MHISLVTVCLKEELCVVHLNLKPLIWMVESTVVSLGILCILATLIKCILADLTVDSVLVLLLIIRIAYLLIG